MPLMKITLTFIVCTLTLFANGQDTSRLKVKLTAWHSDGRQFPSNLDTVFLSKDRSKASEIYTNVTTQDTTFVIHDVPIGKYWLQFSINDYLIFPFPIVVCSKCDNNFPLVAVPKEPRSNNTIFQMIEVSPSYYGDNKALAKDFKRSLTRGEVKLLKQSRDFSVHFYLTKQGVVSDPTILPADLPTEVKTIVAKGLITVRDWRPAQRNGWNVDVEHSLTKAALLND